MPGIFRSLFGGSSPEPERAPQPARPALPQIGTVTWGPGPAFNVRIEIDDDQLGVFETMLEIADDPFHFLEPAQISAERRSGELQLVVYTLGEHRKASRAGVLTDQRYHALAEQLEKSGVIATAPACVTARGAPLGFWLSLRTPESIAGGER